MNDDEKAVFEELGSWKTSGAGSNELVSILEDTEKIVNEVIRHKIRQAMKDLEPIAARAKLMKEERG